jgi:diacylglycerol kinase family enzyme
MASYYQRRAPAGRGGRVITVQRITVLLNPGAGPQDDDVVARVTTGFRRAGTGELDVRVAAGALVRTVAAEAVVRGATVVVAGGGDGTVSAAASVLVDAGATLGILPLGTLNHFAKDLGVPLDLDEAIQAIVGGRRVRVDVGEVNGRPFINNASIGMYASLIAEREAMQRIGRHKWFAHGLAAARVWRRYYRHHIRLQANGRERTIHTPFVFVGNNTYQLSGLELGGRKTLDAGRLHVCMAPNMTRRDVARMIVTAMFGDICRLEGFESFTPSELTLDGGVPRLRVSLDGEVMALDNPLEFRSRCGALQVMVP